MGKGIREFANESFARNMPLIKGEGNAKFRRTVMEEIVLAYGISVASAATHYNHSLKMARIECPEGVKGLGRTPDKTGGRKAITMVDVIKVKTGEVFAAGVSKGAAVLLIATAKAQGKTALAIKEDAVAEPVVEAVTEPTVELIVAPVVELVEATPAAI
jgi:hypothetical protein